MKNYLKFSSLSLAIIVGLSMESFAMDEDLYGPVEQGQVRSQVMTMHEKIENLPSGKYINFRLSSLKLEHPQITYEEVQALSVFGPCFIFGKNISKLTKEGIENDPSIQKNTHVIEILSNTDTLKKLWNEGNHQEVFSWINLPSK